MEFTVPVRSLVGLPQKTISIPRASAIYRGSGYFTSLLPSASTLSNLLIGANSSAIMSWSYNYYDDGRPKKISDSQDNHFDGLLGYAHVGRLKEAYSGREARGETVAPTPNSPYRQTFSYNTSNERNQKTGRFWRTAQSGNTPCTCEQVQTTVMQKVISQTL
jgi:hypothetical protein